MMWLYAPFGGSRSAPGEEGLSLGSRPPLPPSAFGELWREVMGRLLGGAG